MVAGGRELIDTLWNVNADVINEKLVAAAELIDTLWNVNYFSAYFLFLLRVELIDTLWNVNPYFLRNKELVNEN